MAFNGYAVHKPGAPLEPFSYEPEGFGPEEIEIAISHCGICHSDIHLIDNDWQVSSYPFIPGHEIVGEVTTVGRHVSAIKVGQRVGVGWQADSCHTCEWCGRGEENVCLGNQPTCVGRHGGFADHIRVDHRLAFALPEDLASENAAPLLCGGITVYAPMARHNLRPAMRVGVLGIGGLGHLALQFAAAMGCEVTAFSRGSAKEEEAYVFGAHRYVDSTDKAAMKDARGSLDYIVSTISADLDWAAWLKVLRPNGQLVLVGASGNPINVPGAALIGGQHSISGSAIGGTLAMQEMLKFSARHDIVAKTDLAPLSEVNAALDKVRANAARYRMVLKVD